MRRLTVKLDSFEILPSVIFFTDEITFQYHFTNPSNLFKNEAKRNRTNNSNSP